MLNRHLSAMKKVILQTGLDMRPGLPNNDFLFEEVLETKRVGEIEENCYLSEEEKWELSGVILTNQENFSIFLRLSSVFEENKAELAYILARILHYSTQEISKENPYKSIEMESIMETHILGLINQIVGSQLVQAISPVFFSNVNEAPLMHIIKGLFR